MSQVVTLEVSDEVVEAAREMALSTGRTVEWVLKMWLEGTPVDNYDVPESFLNATYAIYTPLGNEKAAEELYTLLQSDEANGDQSTSSPKANI